MNNLDWRCDGESIQGASHIRSGLVNQDAICCETLAFDQRQILLMVVSDGHGGQAYFRSNIGADYAVKLTASLIKQSIPTWFNNPDKLRSLPQQIIDQWRNGVIKHSQEYPFTPAEWEKLQSEEQWQKEISRSQLEQDPTIAYGATLLAIIVTDSSAVYFQLGDGDILCVQSDGTTEHPLLIDPELIANRTTSLCSPQAWEAVRLCVQKAPLPSMILASTDGYGNSYATDQDFFKIGADYLKSIRQEGFDQVVANLPIILRETSRRGSGDDVTLGIMYLEKVASARSTIAPTSTVIQTEPSKVASAIDSSKPRSKLLRRVSLALILLIGASFFMCRWFGEQFHTKGTIAPNQTPIHSKFLTDGALRSQTCLDINSQSGMSQKSLIPECLVQSTKVGESKQLKPTKTQQKTTRLKLGR